MSDTTPAWQRCFVGSCHRHKDCMYRPCRAPTDSHQGIHVNSQAAGAIPNGSRVRKTRSKPNDNHQDGELATVLGSIARQQIGYGYFVEWDRHRGIAVFVASTRIEPVENDIRAQEP